MRWGDVEAAQPDVILVACCGFDLARTQQDLIALEVLPKWQTLAAVRSERVHVIDGSHYFSRPGPRLVDSLEILAHALHPDVHPLPAHRPRASACAKYEAQPRRPVSCEATTRAAVVEFRQGQCLGAACVRAARIEIVGLLTTLNEAADRVAMHAVRRELLEAQAEAAGLPLHTVALPWPCSNAEYEQRMGDARASARPTASRTLPLAICFCRISATTACDSWQAPASSRCSRCGAHPQDTPALARQ